MDAALIWILFAFLAKTQALSTSPFNNAGPLNKTVNGETSRNPVNNYALNCYYERELTEDCAKNFGYYCTSTGQLATTRFINDEGCDTCTCVKIASTALSPSTSMFTEQLEHERKFDIRENHESRGTCDKCSSVGKANTWDDRYASSRTISGLFPTSHTVTLGSGFSSTSIYAPHSLKTRPVRIGCSSSDTSLAPKNKEDRRPIEETDIRPSDQDHEFEAHLYQGRPIVIEPLLHVASLLEFFSKRDRFRFR